METQDIVTVGVVGLILYLVLKPKAKVETFPPYVPEEVVTSTITYNVAKPVASTQYPGWIESTYAPGMLYNPTTQQYMNPATGQQMMID